MTTEEFLAAHPQHSIEIHYRSREDLERSKGSPIRIHFNCYNGTTWEGVSIYSELPNMVQALEHGLAAVHDLCPNCEGGVNRG